MTPPTLLSRREALARLGLALGGALVIGSESYLRAEPLAGKTSANDFSAADIALLDEIGDTIIPATDTPGAKSVKIGAFMVMMVNECYDDAHHAAFKAGLATINRAGTAKFGHDFTTASPTERTALLNTLDAEQKQYHTTKPADAPAHYFRMMKQLTLLGYFTSEPGATQALRFVEVPGRFDGNALYQKGDRNWFTPPGRSI
ncbi:MAG: gluconate 2-dehydrogenase subunit 3 family protein [Lacunisphaera sp.]